MARTGKEMAEQFSDFVNVMTHDYEGFSETVTSEHRFSQQEMFNSMLRCIDKWSQAHEKGDFDARNAYAVNASKIMIDALTKEGLW